MSGARVQADAGAHSPGFLPDTAQFATFAVAALDPATGEAGVAVTT